MRSAGLGLHPPRVLLVAKPWRGGLGRYVFEALTRLLPGKVEWIRTYPEGARERLRHTCNRELWNRGLLERINRAACDIRLFINSPPLLERVDRRAANVLWATDDPMLFLRAEHPFDAVYISDPGYADLVQAAVGDVFAGILPFACSPAVHRPLAGVGRSGACFVANRDIVRDNWLQQLFLRKVPLTVFGNHFLGHKLFFRRPFAFRPAVSNDALGQVYGRFSASLNIHAGVVREGTNMRTFECAAFGIPQLVEQRPGLECYFAPDEEIMVFAGPDEAAAKMERLIGDRVLGARLARWAQTRALAEHTYDRRLLPLLQRC